MDHKSYIRAADASTIKKRAYALFEGMWTFEERLNSTVDSKKRNCYKLITEKDMNKIKSKLFILLL